MKADIRLTDAIVFLQKAKKLVSDVVDEEISGISVGFNEPTSISITPIYKEP